MLKLVEEYEMKYKRKLALTDEEIAIKDFKSYDYETLLTILTSEIITLFDEIKEVS